MQLRCGAAKTGQRLTRYITQLAELSWDCTGPQQWRSHEVELGWMSLRARRDIKQLRYWGKLVKMEDSRLVKQIYKYCKDRTNAQKGSFCHSVQKLLAKLDLGHLWRTEQIGEPKDF